MADMTGADEVVRKALALFAHDLVGEFKRAGIQCRAIDANLEAMAYLDAAHLVIEALAQWYPGDVDTSMPKELQEYRAARATLAAVMGVNPS